ncbi:DNA polymerase III subunit delta' [Myxococcaceae bacterium]|nr:DNA polymerase III subunit delta' [Myxococcaceae bacterium]
MSLAVPYPWQARFAAEWLARRESWPHALLLHGPAGFGKRALAGFLVQGCLCEAPQADAVPCGICPSCHWLREGLHPDLRWIEPVVAEDEGETKVRPEIIRIEQIRELADFVMLSAHRRGRKAVVIAPAEAMNTAAANALLKTLEEPPPGTLLLLVSDRPGRLPATVLSRCTKLAAPRPDAEASLAWLRHEGCSAADALLAQAGGAPLRARELGDATYQAERSAFLAQLAAPARLSAIALGARLDACPKPERKVLLGQWLDLLASWSFDLASLASGGAVRYHPDFAEAAAALAARLAPLPLIRYHRGVLLHKRLIGHPLTPRLVAEQALQAYREAIVSGAAG